MTLSRSLKWLETVHFILNSITDATMTIANNFLFREKVISHKYQFRYYTAETEMEIAAYKFQLTTTDRDLEFTTALKHKHVYAVVVN